ncbi:MAG: serine hydrolase [Betaproteobacteria bacterium]|nr:serine hydrolase [Betaproteobacteria bacterium]
MRLDLAVLVLALVPALVNAADPKPAWGQRLDRELAAIADDPGYRLSGISVLALKGGEIAYEFQHGRRRIDDANPANDRPIGPDTMFRVASISKLVTTLGVLRLVDAGTLDLDRDVSEYLGWRLRNPHFPDTAITLRLLLSHNSSLRDAGGYFWDRTHRLRDVLVPGGALYGEGKAWSAEAAPGRYFSYANLPWGVIAEVMEAATGERFDRLMNRLVLEPLGVPGGYNPAEFSRTAIVNLATLYRKRENLPTGEEIWRDPEGRWYAQVDDLARDAPVSRAGPDYVPGTNGTLMAPQGGLRTSARGLARVMRMLVDGGRADGKAFLKPASMDEFFRTAWVHEMAKRNGDCASESGRPRLFNAWGLGNQQFMDISGPGCGDRLVEGGGFTGHGHLGEAWGLNGVFVFDRKSRDGMIVLVGGVARDPEKFPGKYSAMYRHEERLLTAVYRRAILELE